ncbi:unnamed protein product [Porites evermanni]|uniref:Uncharacterized protein n=1 Tax=Porites evermanni TaxID=104178 RepID=A0ABN8T404_9CNID|nr:unnamed protein product [Porites evermanni]
MCGVGSLHDIYRLIMGDDVDDDAGDDKNDGDNPPSTAFPETPFNLELFGQWTGLSTEWNIACVQAEEHLRATSNFIVKDMERPLHTKEAAANTTTSEVYDSGEDYEENDDGN